MIFTNLITPSGKSWRCWREMELLLSASNFPLPKVRVSINGRRVPEGILKLSFGSEGRWERKNQTAGSKNGLVGYGSYEQDGGDWSTYQPWGFSNYLNQQFHHRWLQYQLINLQTQKVEWGFLWMVKKIPKQKFGGWGWLTRWSWSRSFNKTLPNWSNGVKMGESGWCWCVDKFGFWKS